MSLLNSLRTAFARKSTVVVSGGSDGPATAALWTDQAISKLVDLFTKIPETDELLTNAGISRHSLKKLETDDEIFAALRTRRESVVATPWRFEGGNETDNAFLTEEFKPIMDALVAGAWKSVPYGYSVMEAVYKRRDDGKIGIADMSTKPMEWFDPRPDGSLRYFSPDGADASGEVCDTKFKFFMTRCDPTYYQPKGEALLSRLYWPWFFRFNGWRFWGQFLERYGQPLLVGNSNNTKTMVDALLQVHQDAVIAVAREDKVTVVEPTANGEAFDRLEACVVRRYQKLILGQTLTSDTGKDGAGSYALGKVHADVKEGLRKADLRLVRGTAQNAVNALCALNGITKDLPEIVFADDAGLESERAKRDVDLDKLGVKFTKEYFTDRYDLKDDDFDIVEPPKPPVPGTIPPQLDPDAPDGGNATTVKPLPEDATPETKLARVLTTLASQLGDQSVDTSTVRAAILAATDDSDVTARLSNTMQEMGFAKRRARDPKRFTPAQQMIEDMADVSLAVCGQPIHKDLIRAAVMAARDPRDLADRLAALMHKDAQSPEFTVMLERALYIAEIIGYANAEGKV